MRRREEIGRGFVVAPLAGSPAATAESAVAWVREAPDGADGWIETHRELTPWRKGDSLPEGVIMRAEWASGDSASVRITYDGEQWIGVSIAEHAADRGSVIVDTYLSTVPGDPARAAMVYRTAWSLVTHEDGVRVLEPGLTRFAGWAQAPANDD